MLRDHPHAIHFKHILYFGEAQSYLAAVYETDGRLIQIRIYDAMSAIEKMRRR